MCRLVRALAVVITFPLLLSHVPGSAAQVLTSASSQAAKAIAVGATYSYDRVPRQSSEARVLPITTIPDIPSRSDASVAIGARPRWSEPPTGFAAEAGAGESGIAFGPGSEKAWSTLDRALEKGSPFQGFKGGGTFANDARGGGQLLPRTTPGGDAITYAEWDVNPYIKGVDRGAERIVIGSDGSAYWTGDHYQTFLQFWRPGR